MPFTANYY